MKNYLKNLILLLFVLFISSNTFASFIYEKNIDNLNNTDLESYSYSINNTTDVAIPYIKDMTMIQDDNNYYIDYDIVFENQDLTFDLNNTLITDEIDENYGVNNKVESFSGNIILTEEKDKDFTLNTKVKRENNTYSYTGFASSNNENTDYNIIYTKDSSGSNMLTYDVKLPMTKSTLGVNFKSDIKDVYKNQFLNDFPNKLYGKMFYKATASIICNATLLDNSHFRYKYKGTITIPKQSKDKYKYLQLISPKALKTSIVYNKTTNGVNLVETYKGIKSISIDISNMYVCGANYKENVFYSGNSNHNWTYTNNANTSTHEKYCSKCKWMARENHNLEYEYDGFTHNACKCGYIQKVNVSYLIDGAFQYKKIYNSFSSIEKPVLDIPIGKTISHYVKTELQYLNEDNIDFSETNTPIKEVNIGNVNLINDKTGLYSTIYNAITKVKITTDNDKGGSSGGSYSGGISVFGIPDTEEASPSESEPITENYKLSKGYEEHKYLDIGNSTTQMTQEYNLGTFTIKDSEQNKATLSQVKSLKLRQDNNYYYFDFDFVYENKNIEVNDTSKIGNCLLYVSDSPNNNLSYEYNTYAYAKSNAMSSTTTWYLFVNGTTNNDDSFPAVQYQSLNLKTNKACGTQTMTNIQTKTRSSGYNCVYNPTENIDYYTPEYSSLVFPFEQYLGRYKSGLQTYAYGNTYDVITPNNSSGTWENFVAPLMKLTIGQILWTNGQINKLMPIKPTYQMVNISNQIIDYNKSYWNKELIGTITINKNDINNYKYINMYAPEGIIESKNFNSITDGYSFTSASGVNVNGRSSSSSHKAGVSSSSAKSESAKSFHSYADETLFNINLYDLSNCEHEFEILYSDDVKHIIKCKKCEWEKDENHNYQYEYDGMNNNVCECSKVLHIKNHYQFNSDLVADIVDELEPNTNIATYSNPTKTGYIFKNFNVYHKIPNNYNATNTPLTEKYINTIYELPTRTATYSTIFKANYEPIKYKFKFSKENNLNLISTYSELPIQEFNYDEEKAISDCINIDNYFFKGWSLATNSEIIITPKQLVKNYTTINNQEITLYPNYEPIRFTINYTADKCNFSNGALNLTKNYDLTNNDSLYLDMPILNSSVYEEKDGKYSYNVYTTNYKFIDYEDEFGNKYLNINDVINYVKQNALTNNLILSLKANILQNTTKSYRDGGGGGTGGADPTGGLYKKDIQNIEDLTKYELYNNLDMFIEPQYVPYVKKVIDKDPNMLDVIEKDIKIFGFTLSLDDMKEKLTKEEIVEVEESLKNSHYIVVSSMTNQEKFNMFVKEHKILFIAIFIILMLILISSVLWYFDKLPFLRRNK